jgi:hypothetical protein
MAHIPVYKAFPKLHANVRADKFRSIIEDDPIKYPSIYSFIKMTSSYFDNMARNIDKPRQILKSDGCDILHSVYAPYVDVFRCDKYFRSINLDISRIFQFKMPPDVKSIPDIVS